jgi:hypothetical protein
MLVEATPVTPGFIDALSSSPAPFVPVQSPIPVGAMDDWSALPEDHQYADNEAIYGYKYVVVHYPTARKG